MRLALLLAVVLGIPGNSLASGPPIPTSEEEKGAGFADIAVAATGIFVPGGDGTVRRLQGETLPVVFDAGRKLVSIAVSEDGKHLAAVGAGVLARSSDGGRTFRLESTPDSVMVYAVAFVGHELLLFDVKGRGFRSSRPGAAFQPMALPRAVRYWTASFSGLRGFVVGEQGVLLATEDGGKTWRALAAPGHEAEAVLAVGSTVWVSAREGIFRSDNGGQEFRQVFSSVGNCYRMHARGKAVVAACAPIDHVLAWSADGEHFQEIPVPNAANMMAAAVTPEEQIVAVGANELMVLATPERGRIVVTSEPGRKWLDLITSSRAAEKARAEREKLRAQEGPGRVQCRSGQRGVVLGMVRGAEEAPLSGIPVELMATPAAHGEGYQKVKTGVGGSYRFESTKWENVRVLVEVAGYAPFSRVFSPCPWGETILDIPLQLAHPKGR
jgi:photosystem II stability/assembly factor-like uncharacterized protein